MMRGRNSRSWVVVVDPREAGVNGEGVAGCVANRQAPRGNVARGR
jgi:hypothetical protein